MARFRRFRGGFRRFGFRRRFRRFRTRFRTVYRTRYRNIFRRRRRRSYGGSRRLTFGGWIWKLGIIALVIVGGVYVWNKWLKDKLIKA